MPKTNEKPNPSRSRRARRQAKPAPDLSSLPGPENITRRVLANGIIVLVRENHDSPSVVLDGALKTGALVVPRDKAGLASFTASACTAPTMVTSMPRGP